MTTAPITLATAKNLRYGVLLEFTPCLPAGMAEFTANKKKAQVIPVPEPLIKQGLNYDVRLSNRANQIGIPDFGGEYEKR